MFNKTITKNFIFVISVAFFCTFLASCNFVHSGDYSKVQKNKKEFSDRFAKPKVLGNIKSKEIKESSGLVASRCNKDVFWTHNDSGNGDYIYALNTKGEKLGTWKVAGAKNKDWEDIATLKDKNGKCFLYIGDIGNNSRSKAVLTVYKLAEPLVSKSDKSSSKKKPRTTEKAIAINFSYPKLRRDSETLLVHPETEDIYVLSKRFSGASGVYKLSDYKIGKTNILKKVGKVSVPALPNGFLTGGEISPDGSRIILCDYYNGYELVLPKNAKSFDEIFKDEASIVELGKREQGEAICYSVDGGAIYATSEKQDSPFIEVRRKN